MITIKTEVDINGNKSNLLWTDSTADSFGEKESISYNNVLNINTFNKRVENQTITTIEEVKELYIAFEKRMDELNLDYNTCFAKINNDDNIYRFDSQWVNNIHSEIKTENVNIICTLHNVSKKLLQLDTDHSIVFNEAMYCLNNYVEYAGMVE